MAMGKPFKVVATDLEWSDVGVEQEVLAEIGAKVELTVSRTEDEIIAVARDADAIMIDHAPITRRVIERLERCKIIAAPAIGVNTVDLAAATERGICVSNVPDYCVDEVSDHTMALLLTCARQVVRMNDAVRSRQWTFEVAKPLYRLRGRTLGIVAFGKIARAVAAKGQAFGFRVLAYDPFIPTQALLDQGVQPASLGEVLTQSDFVSLHAPLTPGTSHLIGEDELRAMKPTAFLINTSRGGLVDEKALVKALKEGWIAGAGLDVVEQEPPFWDNPLFSLPNVVITPHAGFYSEDSLEDVRRRASREVIRALTGEWPVCLLNQELKDKIEAPGR